MRQLLSLLAIIPLLLSCSSGMSKEQFEHKINESFNPIILQTYIGHTMKQDIYLNDKLDRTETFLITGVDKWDTMKEYDIYSFRVQLDDGFQTNLPTSILTSGYLNYVQKQSIYSQTLRWAYFTNDNQFKFIGKVDNTSIKASSTYNKDCAILQTTEDIETEVESQHYRIEVSYI